MTADPSSSARLDGASASIAANRTPTGTQSLTVLALRRLLFGVLTLATVAALGWWLTAIIAGDGFGVLDIFLLATFLMYAPWVVIGFWNSTVGFAVLHFLRNPNRSVIPMVERARLPSPAYGQGEHRRDRLRRTLRLLHPERQQPPRCDP